MTDTVNELLHTPFSRLNDVEKRKILDNGRPTPMLSTAIHRAGAKNARKFNPSWYDSHKWLTGSETKGKLYCWPCILLSIKEGAWTRDGYFDMKNLSKAIHKHEMSKEHISNSVNLKRLEKNLNPITELLSEQEKLATQLYNKKVGKNRQIMKRLIDVTVLLCKQELPFRGHDESESSLNRGNFKEIVTRLFRYDDDLRHHWEELGKSFTGLSKTIQNEIIECIYEELVGKIREEIKEAPFFSVQCDDTTDITEMLQLSIIVRYVDRCGIIQERFLGFHEVSLQRSAKDLCTLLLEVLKEFDAENKLIGQCYDGASVMAGEIAGLQTLVRRHAPQALFTHCSAHRLNLVLQNGAKCIKDVRIFFSNLQAFPAFFHKSPKRTSILDKVVGKRIPTASYVRWSSNAKILETIANEREKLLIVFHDIQDDPLSSPESLNGALGLRNQLRNFKFLFLLLVYRDIFRMTEVLFNILQKKSLDVQYCFPAIQIQVKKLEEMRTERKSEEYFSNAKNAADISKICRDGSNGNSTTYRQLYFEILDNILLQLRSRFKDIQNLEFLQLVDSSKFKEHSKAFPLGGLTSLNCQYSAYFDFPRLRNELDFVYSDNQFTSLSVADNIKKFVDSDIHNILPEAYKLFCLAATIPATSCGVERSFSCLKRVKSYLRSTMGQNRLTALATASIERHLLDRLEKKESWYDDVIKRYANRKDRRIALLYK